MRLVKVWTKLFSRNNEADEIALHVSGATVRHRNPFEGIVVQRNDEKLTADYLKKWVAPFYMAGFSNADEATINLFSNAAQEIDTDIVTKLLGDFNWRTRITGAFFAAINDYRALEDMIGGHLLKSEVCYAGSGYCLALAAFGSEKAKKYLIDYLEYYLERKDLWFDQADAFCALEYLDKKEADKLIDKWNAFVVNKENWSLKESREDFAKNMLTLNKIRQIKNQS